MDYLERYDEWLNSPFVDEESKKELESIRDDDDELKFRF